MARAHYAIHSPVRTTGKISGRRKSRRVLLTSLNMLQHPSATRSIASLGRSIPMPVRQYPLIPSTPVHPPVLSTSPLSQPCPAPPSTDHPIPLPLSVLSTADCVLRQWQTDLNPPASSLSLPPFHLSYRGRRRQISMTSRRALLFAPLNSYRSSGRMYMYVCISIIYICVYMCAKTHRLPMIVTSVCEFPTNLISFPNFSLVFYPYANPAPSSHFLYLFVPGRWPTSIPPFSCFYLSFSLFLSLFLRREFN